MRVLKTLLLILIIITLSFSTPTLYNSNAEKDDLNNIVEIEDNEIIVTTNNSYDGEPSLILTKNGFMIAFTSKINSDSHIWVAGDIWVTRSINGRNWSTSIQVNKNITNDCNPDLIEINNGYMIAYHTQPRYIPTSNYEENYTIFITRSVGGVNWSDPKSIVKLSTWEVITALILEKIDNRVVLIYTVVDYYNSSSKLFLTESYDRIIWNVPIEIYSIHHHPPGLGNMYPFITDLSIIQRHNSNFIISYSATIYSTLKGYIIESDDMYNWSKGRLYTYEDLEQDVPFATNPSLLETNDGYLIIINDDGIWKSPDSINWTKISNIKFNDASIVLDSVKTYWVANVSYEKGNSDILFFNIPKPIAYIDSIFPNPAHVSEKIFFQGNGNDSICPIVTYNWQSNIDGFLSNLSSFNISNLSKGEHTIYFKVQNELDIWSEEMNYTLVILKNEDKNDISNLVVQITYIFGVIWIILLIIVLVIFARKKYFYKGKK